MYRDSYFSQFHYRKVILYQFDQNPEREITIEIYSINLFNQRKLLMTNVCFLKCNLLSACHNFPYQEI